jgi:hypothetical protein
MPKRREWSRERKVKILMRYLVRHSDTIALLQCSNGELRWWRLTRAQVERDRKRTWDKIMAADPELVREADNRLWKREHRELLRITFHILEKGER